MRIRLTTLAVAGLLVSFVPVVLAQTAPSNAAKRTADGHPDFTGTWHGAGGGGNRAPSKSVFQGGDAPRVEAGAQLAKQLPLTPKGQELVSEYLKNDGEFGGETTAVGDPRYHSI